MVGVIVMVGVVFVRTIMIIITKANVIIIIINNDPRINYYGKEACRIIIKIGLE